MNESIVKARRGWHVPLWALMMLPVLCAPVFLWLAMRNRESPLERREREYRWTGNPLKYKFLPQDGAPVSWGDDLVKLARVRGPGTFGDYIASSRWLTPDGMIHHEWHAGGDAGGDEGPASTEGLARLPALLRNLPPTDPTARSGNCVLIAFPVKGRWVVRTYQGDSVPKAVKDIARAVGFWKS